MPVVAAHDMY